MNLIEFKRVKKVYGKTEVLRGVSFGVKEGEIVGLVGKSGGGKSTLIKTLIGLVVPDSGEILFEGKKVSKRKSYLRSRVGFVTQENALFEELTVKENCYYFGDLYGGKRSELKTRFEDLIKLTDLEGWENTQVRNLSGGMKKRVNLLASMMHNPRVLIMDEPTVGLDSIIRGNIWEYIRKVNKKEKVTVIIISHLLDEIEENCHRIGLLLDGKIKAMGTLREYRSKYGKKLGFREIFQKLAK